MTDEDDAGDEAEDVGDAAPEEGARGDAAGDERREELPVGVGACTAGEAVGDNQGGDTFGE